MLYEGQSVEEIATIAKRDYAWAPPANDKFFAAESYPNSDNMDLLEKAVQGKLDPKDKVLTTPGYVAFFRKFGVQDIAIYDLSVDRLQKEPEPKKYWGDISNRQIFRELLDSVRPTMLYLSNIPDHVRETSTSSGMVENIDKSPYLKTVVVGQLFESGGYEKFVNQLIKQGWKKQEYFGVGQTEKMVIIQR